MRRAWNGLGLPAALSLMIAAIGCGSTTTSDTTSSSTGAPGTTGGTIAGTSASGTTGTTTGTAASSTASAAAGSSTGAAAGSSTGSRTSAGTTGTTGGSSSGGGAGTTTGGIAHGMGNDGYCDGLAVQQAGASNFLILYPLADPFESYNKNPCTPTNYAPDAGSFPQLGGIWSYYTNSSAQGVVPADCDDLGLGAGPADAGAITPPGGGMTVAEALGLEAGLYDAGMDPELVSLYGVVTFAESYYVSKGKGIAGQYYIQDMPAPGDQPQPNSGVEVYIPATAVLSGEDAGTLPVNSPERGDVMYVTNMKLTSYGNNLEFELGDTSAMTVLGQSAMPPAVSVTAEELESQSTSISGYTGMRVVNKNKYTVTDTCPTIQ